MDVIIGQTVLRNIKLVIFDKDGTLIDVHTYWANMIRFRAENISLKLGDLDEKLRTQLMESMGVDVRTMRIKPQGPVGLKKREIVMHAGIDYLKSKRYFDLEPVFWDAFKEVDIMSLCRFDQIIKPLPGVYELFIALKSSECHIAIATTDLKNRAVKAMQHLNLMGFIDDISGADDVLKPKPDPEMIYLICDKLGIRPDQTLMVGDAISDIKAGQNAGCLASIGVESGLTSNDNLFNLTQLVVPDVSYIKIKEGTQK